MLYIALVIILIFIIGTIILLKNKKLELKEPMIGYYSTRTPYHTKQVHLENRLLRKKIKMIKKSLSDKADWEHRKINSYIPEYSTTKNNEILEINNEPYPLHIVQIGKVNPVITQFNTIDSYDKKPLYYNAPKYKYTYTNRFNCNVPWPKKPYNETDDKNPNDALNYTN